MGFRGDRAEGHRTRLEALHDRFNRFYFFNGYWLILGREIHKSTEGMGLLIIHKGGIFFEGFVTLSSYRLLKSNNGFRTIHMIFCLGAGS